jgi:diguanylate cyclase (GGDEF)-like protein
MKKSPANDAGYAGGRPEADVPLDRDIGGLKAKIAELEAQIRELELLAHIDPLVELPNRRSIFRDLERVIAHLVRSGGQAAVIFVDVDGLKKINDVHGHPVGDAALVKIARTLVQTVRKSDVVGRLSGDEFIILLPDADELGAWNMALRIAECIIASPLKTDGLQVNLSVAVGVTTVRAGDRPDDVISRADQAMYKIKMV